MRFPFITRARVSLGGRKFETYRNKYDVYNQRTRIYINVYALHPLRLLSGGRVKDESRRCILFCRCFFFLHNNILRPTHTSRASPSSSFYLVTRTNITALLNTFYYYNIIKFRWLKNAFSDYIIFCTSVSTTNVYGVYVCVQRAEAWSCAARGVIVLNMEQNKTYSYYYLGLASKRYTSCIVHTLVDISHVIYELLPVKHHKHTARINI